MGPTPERPFLIPSQKLSFPIPVEESTPKPVTTILRDSPAAIVAEFRIRSDPFPVLVPVNAEDTARHFYPTLVFARHPWNHARVRAGQNCSSYRHEQKFYGLTPLVLWDGFSMLVP